MHALHPSHASRSISMVFMLSLPRGPPFFPCSPDPSRWIHRQSVLGARKSANPFIPSGCLAMPWIFNSPARILAKMALPSCVLQELDRRRPGRHTRQSHQHRRLAFEHDVRVGWRCRWPAPPARRRRPGSARTRGERGERWPPPCPFLEGPGLARVLKQVEEHSPEETPQHVQVLPVLRTAACPAPCPPALSSQPLFSGQPFHSFPRSIRYCRRRCPAFLYLPRRPYPESLAAREPQFPLLHLLPQERRRLA